MVKPSEGVAGIETSPVAHGPFGAGAALAAGTTVVPEAAAAGATGPTPSPRADATPRAPHTANAVTTPLRIAALYGSACEHTKIRLPPDPVANSGRRVNPDIRLSSGGATPWS